MNIQVWTMLLTSGVVAAFFTKLLDYATGSWQDKRKRKEMLYQRNLDNAQELLSHIVGFRAANSSAVSMQHMMLTQNHAPTDEYKRAAQLARENFMATDFSKQTLFLLPFFNLEHYIKRITKAYEFVAIMLVIHDLNSAEQIVEPDPELLLEKSKELDSILVELTNEVKKFIHQ